MANNNLTPEEVELARALFAKLAGGDTVVRVKPRQMSQDEFDAHVEEQNARTKREQDYAANPMQAHFELEERVARLELKLADHAADTEMQVSAIGDQVRDTAEKVSAAIAKPPPAPSSPTTPPAGA